MGRLSVTVPRRQADDHSLDRYQRHIDLAGFGVHGQERLAASSVLVIGAGGLGSAALPYLVAAGVGRVSVADGDRVVEHNLPRQVLHTEVGCNKAASAVARLSELNSEVVLVAYPELIDYQRTVELALIHDVVIDCTDGFETKLMISDACAAAGRPLVWGAAVGVHGQCSVFGVPCADGYVPWLRDVFDSPPEQVPTATEIGVLGPMAGQIGALQASEAIKVITGLGRPLVGRICIVDAASGRWDIVEFTAQRLRL